MVEDQPGGSGGGGTTAPPSNDTSSYFDDFNRRTPDKNAILNDLLRERGPRNGNERHVDVKLVPEPSSSSSKQPASASGNNGVYIVDDEPSSKSKDTTTTPANEFKRPLVRQLSSDRKPVYIVDDETPSVSSSKPGPAIAIEKSNDKLPSKADSKPSKEPSEPLKKSSGENSISTLLKYFFSSHFYSSYIYIL